MSEIEIRLPDVGEGVAQAEVVQWHVAVGDPIAEDQPFVDVMTDKATVELPSPVRGVVTRLAADVGDFVAVGAPLVWVTVDQDAPVDTRAMTAVSASPDPRPTTLATPEPEPEPARPRARAAPAVRRRATDLGIDLAAITGTGVAGRVVHADLDARLAGGHRAPAPPQDQPERIQLTGLRRNIARRMQEAHRIPHFGYVERIDVGALEQLRAQLNDSAAENRPRLTILPFLMRAVTTAIIDFPEMNARYDADTEVLERHDAVHLGIATQAPNGLMVPVVRNAHQGNLWQNAADVRRLVDAAVAGTIKLADLTGSTITITSLGALGGLMSTPIINAPEVAIIGVNRIVEQPTLTDGQLHNRMLMNLSSSFDHRVVDGWNAARFIHRIKALLESPALLFVDK